ncbi:MAG: hypothetical protein HY788_03495 [Deltaproteobacteria bacterium]|nr:hypothetical protein [Deltaproteobacteria bacterium]
MTIPGRGRILIGSMVVALSLIIPCGALAAIQIITEASYGNTEVVVEVYMNTTASEQMRSFGIKLFYDQNKLSIVSAQRAAAWSLAGYPYQEPETQVPGQVTAVGGFMNLSSPGAGLSGPRILLCRIRLARIGAALPPYGITGALGKANPYANFVNTGGVNLDGSASFPAPVVAARGDANADQVFTNADMFKAKDYLNDGQYRVFADCNEDGVLTQADILCIRTKIMDAAK